MQQSCLTARIRVNSQRVAAILPTDLQTSILNRACEQANDGLRPIGSNENGREGEYAGDVAWERTRSTPLWSS
jgi:hypothetical protein